MLYNMETKKAIEEAYLRKKEKLGALLDDIDSRLEVLSWQGHSEDLLLSMKFIFAHLPASDIAEETIFATILDYAETALYARAHLPWGQEIPTDIFLSDVLFPRVNNEWLEPVRRLFFEMLCERVQDKTMEEAIIETNYFCFEQATYVGSDIRTAPPSTLLKSAQGRCGEESVFGIMALRSIGIPARQIYVPRWAHCDSNHAWVEVWCRGEWHYLGACEPEEWLDRGWFTSAASRAMLVENRAFYAAAAGNRTIAEESVKAGLVYNVNRTSHYAAADKLVIHVADAAGQPLKGLRVMLEVINSAGFIPIGELVTDTDGSAEITIGKGSVHLHVTDGCGYMERWIDTSEVSRAAFVWEAEMPRDYIADFDTVAPIVTGVTNRPLDEAAMQRQKANTEKALNIRRHKEAAFWGGEECLSQAEMTIRDFSDIIDGDILRDILTKARGNYSEIIGFLSEHKTRYAALLLTTLNDKDYSDCRKDVLAAHLNHALSYAAQWEEQEDIFVNYVLAPRIYFEHMTDYRAYLAEVLSEEQKASFAANPQQLWEHLEAKISYMEDEGTANLLATPAAVMRSGYGSLLSRKILFAAVLRTLGVPARLTQDTLHIEYYNGTDFVQVTKDEAKDAVLKLRFADDSNWIYGFNWSVSRLRNGVFEYLDFSGEAIADNCMPLKLTHGCYRVVTSNRLPNGNNYCRMYEVVLDPDREKELNISLRPISERDMISRAKINDFQVLKTDKTSTNLTAVLAKGQNVLLWLVEDQEPSQHILNELLTLQHSFRDDVNITFLLSGAAAVKNGLISRAAKALNAKVVIDTAFANAEPAARMTFVDPDKLPLAMIANEQLETSYAISGYNVGTADMIRKILDMIQ